ncbi:hypothetical protein [Chthonobacter rhizosphaerae]|uniref:hypothetical protein n=1 Tax=Chthonobacter rhizosphaerae TaxID=2735553 RepID=UPI0015EEE0B0|nr:hypothetical protein [Chthonobacter rhizosphaerae]
MRFLLFCLFVAFAVPVVLAVWSPAAATECRDKSRPCPDERTTIRKDRREGLRPGNVHRDAEIGRYTGGTQQQQQQPCGSQPNIRDRNVVQNSPRC